AVKIPVPATIETCVVVLAADSTPAADAPVPIPAKQDGAVAKVALKFTVPLVPGAVPAVIVKKDAFPAMVAPAPNPLAIVGVATASVMLVPRIQLPLV